jgi:hypothetical protein
MTLSLALRVIMLIAAFFMVMPNAILLNVIILSVVMLSVVLRSVVMLSVASSN